MNNKVIIIEMSDEIEQWLNEKTAPNGHRKYSRCPVCRQTWQDDNEQHSFVCWVPRFRHILSLKTVSK